MTIPYLSGATGNPINLARRVAQQSVLGVPADVASTWRDFRSNGGPFLIEGTEIERAVIAAGGQPQGNLPGKRTIGGGPLLIGDVDPANYGLLHCLANLYGKYAVVDNTTWQQWNFALDAATSAAGWLTLRNDNDILPRYRVSDVLVTGLTISTSPNENLAASFDLLAGEYDFHGDVTQEAGSGSTKPILKRTWSGQWDETADYDIYIRVDSQTATTATISTKVGAAAAYSASQVVTFGQWNRLFDESGARIGTLREQVLLYWPSSPTLTDPSDIFKAPMRTAAWSPSLAVDRPISSVNTIFVLDGVEYRTEGGWELSIAWANSERIDDVAGAQGAHVERTGNLVATLTPTRRITDLTFQEAMHNAATRAAYIDCMTDVEIGASGRPYRFLIGLPQCKLFGQLFDAQEGGTNRDEAPRLVAEQPDATGTYDSKSFDAHAEIFIENDLTAL